MPDSHAPLQTQIELSIHDIGQLWHTLDPLPFRERDLDQAVEEFLVSSAAEMAQRGTIEILVRLPKSEADREEARHVSDAIRHYFGYRADVVGWELRELFRTGRTSLAVGLVVLAACMIAAQFATKLLGGQVGRFFEEGLIILGWVANWQPIQIFLYGWQPMTRRRGLYRRLASANVTLLPS